MEWLYFFLTFLAALVIFYLIYLILLKNDSIPKNTDDALLSNEALINHASKTARNHSISPYSGREKPILLRLEENYRIIFKCHKILSKGALILNQPAPGMDWLLDNFYIIEKEIKVLKHSINRKFFKRLSTLKSGNYKKFPRIYAVAQELISHTDGRFDKDTLINFITAYQSVSLLSIAEIWALQIMLRIALIEKLRNTCEKILSTFRQWEMAEETKGLGEKELLVKLNEIFSKVDELPYAYLERIIYYMRSNINNEEINEYLNSELIKRDTNPDKLIKEEHQRQASIEITMSNCITSLRLIAAMDWKDIFESISVVENILSSDPLGIYKKQDFETRDLYRRKIEMLAKKFNVSETYVARCGIKCASDKDVKGRYSHVGYYIIDDGICELKSILTGKNYGFRHNNPVFYIAVILFLTAVISLYPSIHIYINYRDAGKAVIAFLLCLIPISEVSVMLTNYVLSKISTPTILPKLKFDDDIPIEFSTLIIVPTLIPSKERIKEIIKQLEVTYLSNYKDNMYFAIVGDFKDSEEQFEKTDCDIVAYGIDLINKLNEKYSPQRDVFFLFMRERRFNESQNRWMGWERKRGAIIELNEMVKGSSNTSFKYITGDITNLKNIKYVITLDADTIMPINAASLLIGTISHPLNDAVVDFNKGIVNRGYGLIQPRIGINIESSFKTLFSNIFASNGGIDPYSRAVSDVYQDLFKEGIFTGKGIYNLDVFNSLLNNTFPDNSILSHDLIEGSFIRVGLDTSIELIDSYPEKYSSYMMRLHRWVRGDWQLIRWIFPIIYDRDRNKRKNPLNILSKWKIFDNLRRSLLSISLFLLLIFAFTLYKGISSIFIFYALIPFLTPILFCIIDGINSRNIFAVEAKFESRLIYGFKNCFYQSLLNFIFLPYNAYMMTDAVARSIYRIFFSRKNLLEWVTAAEAEKKLKNNIGSYLRRMFPSTIISFSFFFLIIISGLDYTGLLISIIWILNPYIAFLISKPIEHKEDSLSKEEIQTLRRISRKTWSFYEDFSIAEDNYLPIDNLQTNPVYKIAHRTSPTNIGFLLIATASARDLGYITNTNMIERLNNTLSTIENMEKWNGHLYNWYETKNLNILKPRYVSTVDSGNFICYLITLYEALKEYLSAPLFSSAYIQGLNDTICVYGDGFNSLPLLFSDSFNLSELKGAYNFCDKNIELYNKNSYNHTKIRELCFLIKGEIDLFFKGLISTFEKYKDILPDNFIQLNKNFIPSCDNLIDIYIKLKDSIGLNELKEENIEDIKLIDESLSNIEGFKRDISELLNRIDSIVEGMKFNPLYDSKRGLFSIGYNADEDKLTNSYYDLLASEARISSFLAVARREVPNEHWFKLGRSLTVIDGYRSLVSWTGTMFEYMMPALIMKTYRGTLLYETCKTSIRAQIKHLKGKNIPWGISESGYYAFDLLLNYQYKAFGIPTLGLKRGLVKDVVISPYSSLLALLFFPRDVVRNINSLMGLGLEGKYGFYEAVDFTHNRLPRSLKFGIVESFMAHHQGMILISLNNFFNGEIMVKRFHSNPVVKAGEILLQEKVPLKILVTKQYNEPSAVPTKKDKISEVPIRSASFNTAFPICHLLSNGNYTVFINNRGSGYSRMNDIEINRFRHESITSKYGNYILIKDLKSMKCFSNTFDPLMVEPDFYEARFSSDKIEFIRIDGKIETKTEICVSPEDNCEIRRVTLSNHSEEEVILECTGYLEPSLFSHTSDLSHPAFNKLFLTTEILDELQTIIVKRRPKAENDNEKFLFQTLSFDGEPLGVCEFETDRFKLTGRFRDITDPQGLNRPHSGSFGIVLDPVISLRQRIKIPPLKSEILSITTGIVDSREDVINLSKKYTDILNIRRAFELSYIRSLMENRFLNLTDGEVKVFEAIIPHLTYISPSRARYERIILKNQKGQIGLWPYGISGDNPILLLLIKETEYIDTVKLLIKAHEYLRLKGFKFDLVIMNEDSGNYQNALFNLIRDIILSTGSRDFLDKNGGIFIRNSSTMPDEDRILLYSAAALIIKGDGSNIINQIEYFKEKKLYTEDTKLEYAPPSNDEIKEDLLFFNGYGGFSREGEYIIKLNRDVKTPLPWSNIIANKDFGTMVTDGGLGFTYCLNSRENKITPWSNDPVSDSQGEAIYIKDKDNNIISTAAPLPGALNNNYRIAHGRGYSSYIHRAFDVDIDTIVTVPLKDKVKIILINLKNNSSIVKNLSLYYYIKPVMGAFLEQSGRHIITRYFDENNAIFITNPFNNDFNGCVSFISSNLKISSFTCDNIEFIGLNGTLKNPRGLYYDLSKRQGTGFENCCVIKVDITLNPNDNRDVSFILGQDDNIEYAINCISKYNNIESCKEALREAKDFFNNLQSKLIVNTPDAAVNTLLNSFLIYQALTCRLWARCGFYQCGGAFGFRDQLQDTLCLLNTYPEAAKSQILLHAEHQYKEGDVQHWWHPGCDDKGIRTRYTDDLLWLPYCVSEYIEKTGDYSILDEEVNYIEDDPLCDKEMERYCAPRISEDKGTIYNHCIRAIEKSLNFGRHNIPKIGGGDWNDGLNAVGMNGEGESIWLGWFLYDILNKFANISEKLNDISSKNKFKEISLELKNSLNNNCYDGEWYIRAFFDDGSPLGSSSNLECRIDSIAQAWSVISKGGTDEKVLSSMNSLDNYLVKRDEGVILLLTPPFDKSLPYPGYIKGYTPGVRENGGQYTHAACWVVMALCRMGLGNKAFEYYSMINPISHTMTQMECLRYKAEPYVMAADVYYVNPHYGRGGWTWYTGSASWMYKVGVEEILGFKKLGDSISINPCIPSDWREYSIEYKYKNTKYIIKVKNPNGKNAKVNKIIIDGKEIKGCSFPLLDNKNICEVEAIIGE